MSIEARLVEAFDGLMNSPAAANTYKGPDAEYITFNYTEIPGKETVTLDYIEE